MQHAPSNLARSPAVWSHAAAAIRLLCCLKILGNGAKLDLRKFSIVSADSSAPLQELRHSIAYWNIVELQRNTIVMVAAGSVPLHLDTPDRRQFGTDQDRNAYCSFLQRARRLDAGINSNLSMSDVAFLNSTAGFTGGALHLQNTQHITAGQPFVNVTIAGSFSAGFAGAVNVFGGETAQRAIRGASACTVS